MAEKMNKREGMKSVPNLRGRGLWGGARGGGESPPRLTKKMKFHPKIVPIQHAFSLFVALKQMCKKGDLRSEISKKAKIQWKKTQI